jgi:hypothetical protein
MILSSGLLSFKKILKIPKMLDAAHLIGPHLAVGLLDDPKADL